MRKGRYCVCGKRERRGYVGYVKRKRRNGNMYWKGRDSEGENEKWEMENETHKKLIKIFAENGLGENWMKEIEREGRE